MFTLITRRSEREYTDETRSDLKHSRPVARAALHDGNLPGRPAPLRFDPIKRFCENSTRISSRGVWLECFRFRVRFLRPPITSTMMKCKQNSLH